MTDHPKNDAELMSRLLTTQPTPAECLVAAARIEQLLADLDIFAKANNAQANCIHLTAQALGPDFAATVHALPKAAASVKAERDAAVDALTDIATIGRIITNGDCTVLRDHARATLSKIKESKP